MKSVLHKAESRGHANHGWLDTWHTFSFAGYYNPERMQFGMLRVLNDDTVSPGMGFGRHPHNNMEIISIPLSGDLEHSDSMGNVSVIREGELQVMSAGTGIYHSEHNKNRDRQVQFLQIWILPDRQNVEPRYDQVSLKEFMKINDLFPVLSPHKNERGVWIHQDAWFYMGEFTEYREIPYSLKKSGNGVYLFVIEGSVKIGDHQLERRDGLGIWQTENILIQFSAGSKLLLMEVPMNGKNSSLY